MRSVRSGPKKYSQRRSRAAWKYLLGAMLPTVCIGAFHVASAEPTDLHVAAHNQPAWAEQLKGQTIVEDAKEGQKAFQEKRKPVWKNK